MDKLELRRQALGLVANMIRSNVESGLVSDLDQLQEPERHELEVMLLQLAEELGELAARKPRNRPAHPVEAFKPYWLSVMRVEGGDQPRQQYKTLQRARMAAKGLINKENADPEHLNPAQRVWIYMGEGKAAKVVACYRRHSSGQAERDEETMRQLGAESAE